MGDGIDGGSGGGYYDRQLTEEDVMGGGVDLGGGEYESTAVESFVMPSIEEFAEAGQGKLSIYMWGKPSVEAYYMVAVPVDADPIEVTAAHRSFMAGWDGQDIEFTGIMEAEQAAILADQLATDLAQFTSPHGVPVERSLDSSSKGSEM